MRQRYTVIGTKNGYNVKDFIMAYSETEARLIYKRSRADVEVTECYITKVNDWHKTAQQELQEAIDDEIILIPHIENAITQPTMVKKFKIELQNGKLKRKIEL